MVFSIFARFGVSGFVYCILVSHMSMLAYLDERKQSPLVSRPNSRAHATVAGDAGDAADSRQR